MPTVPTISQILSHTATASVPADDWVLISPASPVNRDGVFIHAIDANVAIRLINSTATITTDAGYVADPTESTMIVEEDKAVYIGCGENVAIYGSGIGGTAKTTVTEVV